MNDPASSRRSNPIPQAPSARPLPHQRLLAYQVALRFVAAVHAAAIRDAHLRDQALRAATSACLNTAEGAARVSRADRSRSFGIARAEACEAAAAVEIAAAAGFTAAADLPLVLAQADHLVALLTGLITR